MSRRRFTVVWTDVALIDVERLAAYLFEEAPLRADQIVERVISRGQSLETSPMRGRTPPELRAIGDTTWREIQEPPWRILYKVAGRIVQIHGVLDGRRSLDDVLMERLIRA